MARILVVEDDRSLREVLDIFLTNLGHEVLLASTGEEAIAFLERSDFDLVLTDLKLGGLSGISVLEKVKAVSETTEVIMMTAYSTVETAIEAMRKGAFDYVGKPFKLEEISITIDKALEKRALAVENIALKRELSSKYRFDQIIGKTAKMRQVFDTIAKVAPTKTSVLITGESGTGKELVAKAIHYNSPRRDKPFVVVNCGAIPDTLMESELFGHVKGAFTGAYSNKKGLLESASGGTVFLDEIGELSLPMQVKLLRYLQDHKVRPVGSLNEIIVDARVVAATNKDLAQEVEKGRFREDLYYRLNVIRIHLPPLRERIEDIPYLVHHFVLKYCKEIGRKPLSVSPEVMEHLKGLRYPGNIRELENIIEHAVTFANHDVITMDSLPQHVISSPPVQLNAFQTVLPPEGINLEERLAEIEKEMLVTALKKAQGVRKEAAKLLGISFRSIRYKLSKYGIVVNDGEEEEEACDKNFEKKT